MNVDASFFSPESDDGGGGDGDRRRRPMGSISWAVVVGIGGPPTGGGDGDRRRRPMGLISSSLFRRDSATTGDDCPDLPSAAREEGEVSESE